MKKHLILVSLLLSICLLSACAAAEAKTNVNIAVLKGPTGMGAAWLMAENDAGRTDNQYAFTVAGAPDALVAQLITGELDIAALPTNTIAMLYQKSQGGVQALAVNTLGVLYVLERGDTVSSAADLAGRKIVAAGRGTTVEVVAQRLFPDAEIDYVSEHAEAVAQAVAGQYDLVLVPEPFVTSLLKQNADFRIALDITAAWAESDAGALPMGGIAVRRAFAEQHPEAIDAFLSEYAQSVTYANENPADAAALIQQYDIMQAAVAESAISRANMVCLVGADMRTELLAFYTVLLADNPALIGGALPSEDFYYAP